MPNSVSPWAAGRIRRRAVVRAGAVLAAGLALAAHRSSAAQAPPLATPQTLGPPIPPEITDYAHDWPAPGQNLAAHRAAIDSPISGATVDRLQVAWRLPLTANGPYEAVAAVPLVVGETIYLQDTESNVFAAAHLNSGGGVWYTPSVDAEGNIYFGTGNPAPWPEIGHQEEETTRPGPNIYTSSMVSLDPISGRLRWYVQATPHDVIDHDFQLTPVLATVEIEGEPVPLAIGSGKTGTVIAANAESGEVTWEVSVGEHNAYGDGAPLSEPSATPVTVLPGPFGGVLSPLAFAENTVFVPVINAAYTYSDTSDRFDLEQATGEMVALNTSDGSVRWQSEVETFFAGGATVANDLVFGAGLDGFVRAFDSGTGREVWRFRAGAGLNAPLAIAGDLLLVPAGGPFFSGQLPPPPAQNELIA